MKIIELVKNQELAINHLSKIVGVILLNDKVVSNKNFESIKKNITELADILKENSKAFIDIVAEYKNGKKYD